MTPTRVDELTTFGTREALDEAADREVARCRRSGASLSLVVFDVDEFGAVNEAHGRARGDQLLKAVAGVIVIQVRKPDLCFRWGGDEFAVLLPDTPRSGASELARRIRGITAAEMRRPDGRPLSLTAGIAQLAEGQDPSTLLENAGRDLLRAKRATGVSRV